MVRGHQGIGEGSDPPPPPLQGVQDEEGSLLASRSHGQSWQNATSQSMVKPNSSAPARVNANSGHLALHVDGMHGPELAFSFEHRQSEVGVGAAVGAHVLFAIIAILIYTYAPAPGVGGPVAMDRLSDKIVWLSEPGPGGGGGGGGNQMPEPPKKAEVPGKHEISVPVVKKNINPQPKLEEPKDPAFNIPAKSLGDAQQMTPGMLESAMAASMISQGTGTNGGAGAGAGTGIGPGKGAGLGPGEGGGAGGGVYRPGNGVEIPRLIREVKPQYTAEAMRAKVQGVVWVDAVVLPDGSVGEVNVTKSLDSTFGLDQEALKAAKQWKFMPGRRFGQPVSVLVSIELTFTLR
jgi:protein TonB